MNENVVLTKIVAYIGTERCNILHCLVNAEVKAGKRVLVVDNSITHDYYNLYVAGEDGVVNLDKLVICKDSVIERDILDSFDYVFIYVGLNTPDAVFVIPDHVIAAPSYDKNSMVKVGEMLSVLNSQKGCLCVMRDKAGKKISDSATIGKLKIAPKYFRSLELSYSEHAAYIALTHNGKTKKYEGDIVDVATELFEIINDVSLKVIKKNKWF